MSICKDSEITSYEIIAKALMALMTLFGCFAAMQVAMIASVHDVNIFDAIYAMVASVIIGVCCYNLFFQKSKLKSSKLVFMLGLVMLISSFFIVPSFMVEVHTVSFFGGISIIFFMWFVEYAIDLIKLADSESFMEA